jgi:hypothetical protein
MLKMRKNLHHPSLIDTKKFEVLILDILPITFSLDGVLGFREQHELNEEHPKRLKRLRF